ncbi:MAG: hypothetical protein WBA44_11805 [Mesorhizobium sp.]
MAKHEMLKNSIIIGAHPDDELLWFASILKDVDEVVLIYEDFFAEPNIGDARRKVIAEFPHPNVTSLGMSESGAAGCADWRDPRIDRYGIKLGIETNRRILTGFARKSYATIRPSATDRPIPWINSAYQENFELLKAFLRPRLRADMNVFTHNPWGEYGHEEHVQLFRVLDGLRQEIGFKLWMSNYCTNRALPLAMRYFAKAAGPYVRLPVDKDYAQKLADLYIKHGCWTWPTDWRWFDEECFMEAPSDDQQPLDFGHLFPLNMFTMSEPKSSLRMTTTVAASAAGVALAAIALTD